MADDPKKPRRGYYQLKGRKGPRIPPSKAGTPLGERLESWRISGELPFTREAGLRKMAEIEDFLVYGPAGPIKSGVFGRMPTAPFETFPYELESMASDEEAKALQESLEKVQEKLRQENEQKEFRRERAKLQAGGLYNGIAAMATVGAVGPAITYVLNPAKGVPGWVYFAVAGGSLLVCYALYAIAEQTLRSGWK